MGTQSSFRYWSAAAALVGIAILAGCSRSDPRDLLMFDAILRGELSKVAQLHTEGYDLNRRMDVKGWTPLTLATGRRDPELLRYLLQNGARVDFTKNSAWAASNRTALSFTSENNDTPSSRVLLLAGADPNARDLSGKTPLHHAAAAASLEALVLLLQNGARVNARDAMRATPLIYAAHARGPRALACVRTLLARGADPSARTKAGQGAVDWARDPRIVQELKRAHDSRRSSGRA